MVIVKSMYKVTHFWIILAIMAFGAFIYYADQIPLVQTIISQIPIGFTRYSTYRILSIIPVAYAAFVFRLRGGVITAIFVGLALLPRALFYSSQVYESIAETIAFFFMGLMVSWLINRQQRAFHQLEKAQKELQANVLVIKENERRLAALNQISSTVSESLELDHVLSNAIDSVVGVMQADVAWIFLLDEENGVLSLAAHRGSSEELAKGVDRLRLGEGFNGSVAQSGQPLFVEDASKDPRLTREVVSKYELHSTLIVPLRSKRKVDGTLTIAMYSHREFQPEEIGLLIAIGNQIGVAVDNANLYKQQQITSQHLRISEERYRGLFENSSDAIFLCSTSARIISVNQACEQLTGYTPKELTSMVIYKLFRGESREKVRQLFSAGLEQVTVGRAEDVRLTRKDGTEAFVDLRTSHLLRKEEVIGIQVIAQDVTEEKQLRRNMEYYIKQVTRAQEDERLRISRELHDDTAQILLTLSRDLDLLITGEKKPGRSMAEPLKKLRSMAESALEGVRRFSQDLRPSILDDLGLVPALEWLVTDLKESCGMTTRFEVTGSSRRLVPEIELAVFRIVQEVLSNVRRHSQASAVEVALDFGSDALTLIISDNGKGFDMPQRTSDLALSGKLGIIGIRERTRLIGGTIIVQSEPGGGTTVTLRVPS
jgi:PAS domain S-box-containing protein